MPAKPNEIVLTRVYDAPLSLMWEVWTEQAHLERWWGPRGFTITTKHKEIAPGGKWIFAMHGPDGADYPNQITYHEVVPFERLVYDHGTDEARPKAFSMVVTFAEAKGKTTVCIAMAVATPEAAREMAKHIKRANGTSTWDRLGEYLEHKATGAEVLLVTRSFATDAKTLFAMWHAPADVAKWLPRGGAITASDAGEGGSARWSITTPAGTIALQSTATFAAEGGDAARVTLRCAIAGEVTAAAREAFSAQKRFMNEAWNDAFDQLDVLLAPRS